MIQLTTTDALSLIGLFTYLGGMLATVIFNRKAITSLWKAKQERILCDEIHRRTDVTMNEIKEDVKWLVQDRKNGGGA